MKRTVLLLAALLLPPAARAQDLDYFNFEKASLRDVINIHSDASSRLDFAGREAPAIVTVLTRDEILDSGARNVFDVLSQVPGLDFGVDVEGNIGLGVRGNWAQEGKVLVLVDGQRYNEDFMGTAQLERIPVEEIEKIEVIRGPGSVIYGGSAELGVIKITTLKAKEINGERATAAYGRTAKGAQDGSFNFAYGRSGPGGRLTVQLYLADADKGDRRYTDFNGGSYSMEDASQLKTRSLNLGFFKDGWKARVIADLYRTRERDGWTDTILPRPMDRDFDSYFAELRRDFRPSDLLSVSAALNATYEKPYWGFDPEYYFRDKTSRYLKATVNAVYAASPRARLSAGAEASVDSARLMSYDAAPSTAAPLILFANGRRSVSYANSAVFMEGMEEFSFGTLSAGARYDDNQDFNSAFSPRIAWTKAMDKLHFKAIYGMGFRSPGIDNLAANPQLKPEKSKTTELETGYMACGDVYLTADVFDMRIDDPIVFYTDGAGQHYGNYGHTGTRGFELSAKVKKNWGYANLSYSYYVAYDNKVDFYNSGVSGTLLAFARGKAALNASFNVSSDLILSPSAVYYAGRRGYTAANTVTGLGDVALVNIYLARKSLMRGRLELGFGVYNIFNAPYSYIQPYDGGHSPLPALSREFRTRAAYRF